MSMLLQREICIMTGTAIVAHLSRIVPRTKARQSSYQINALKGGSTYF